MGRNAVQTRRFAVLAAVAATAGCGLTGPEPSTPPEQSGRISIGDSTQKTQSVSCTQTQWDLTIDAKAETGRARAFLQLGGDRPVVRTVAIENINGLNGAVGTGGKAEASVTKHGGYTITGTAVVTDAANPAQTKDLPFKIDVTC
jgi:predicted small lipoprotein YifL